MPTYDLVCTNKKCGHRFEQVAKMSECNTIKCPKCGKKTKIIPHATGIIFRGSGWESKKYNDANPHNK